MNRVIQGDCLDVMREMPDNSVDAVVTDPPYGLSFMGKKWDYDVPTVEVWREVLRVLKPGGHLLSFAGTRTHHRMAVNIEDAGFDLRDTLMWVYGSGFPKSHDVSKAIDREAGADREVVVGKRWEPNRKPGTKESGRYGEYGPDDGLITAPATPAAQQWEGWGSALKPSFEPITLARKPLQGTLAQNVQEHGTGGLNIDGCRVGTNENDPNVRTNSSRQTPSGVGHGYSCYGAKNGVDKNGAGSEWATAGRWPANLIHSGEPEVVACFPETTSGERNGKKSKHGGCHGGIYGAFEGGDTGNHFPPSSGSAARFFKQCPDDDPEDAETRRLIYQGKATKRDRDEGLEGFEERKTSTMNGYTRPSEGRTADKDGGPKRNTHPCVKPTPLMQYLCRLITPPGGIILDPFTGSGSTGKAAVLEGFGFIGIEQEPEYVAIANARIAAAAARSEKASLEQRVAWLETQVQAQGAKLKRIEASQQLSLWGTP